MSRPRFGKGLLASVLTEAFPAVAPKACGLPESLLHWVLRSPWACQALAGQRVLVGCVTISGGSWLDKCDPSIKGLLGGR